MLKTIKTALACLLVTLAGSSFAASPMGYWKTIDDVTGNAKSIVRITGNATDLTGQVVKLFPGAMTVCTACKGDLKDKPIQGMTVMYGLKQDASSPNEWSEGTILDPKSGDVYHCKLKVADDGKSMVVRGYVGISAFGRSQTWVKVSGKQS
jgi:uncharacterized protein (DUF2147 family)